jgi:hypothetical protein
VATVAAGTALRERRHVTLVDVFRIRKLPVAVPAVLLARFAARQRHY